MTAVNKIKTTCFTGRLRTPSREKIEKTPNPSCTKPY